MCENRVKRGDWKCTYVVCSVTVFVNAAEERCGDVLANGVDEQLSATGVQIQKVGHVVDEARDENQWASLRQFLI